MDKNLDSILSKLKVISKIESGHKILVEDSQIHIMECDKSSLDRFRKWWLGETRQTTMSKLRGLYLEVHDIIQELGNSIELNQNVLERLRNEITNSLRGLQNLMITYQNDRTIVSQLETLVENFRLEIKQIEHIKISKNEEIDES
jgi:hypothetical protein